MDFIDILRGTTRESEAGGYKMSTLCFDYAVKGIQMMFFIDTSPENIHEQASDLYFLLSNTLSLHSSGANCLFAIVSGFLFISFHFPFLQHCDGGLLSLH